MIGALPDLAGLLCLALVIAADGAGRRAGRFILVLMKLVPVTVLAVTLGPRGIGWIACVSGILAAGLARLSQSTGGRAHLVTGLSAGALFASGPFGAVVTGGALAASAFAAQRSAQPARALDVALVLFVPLVVVAGFAVAAAAQTGDPFALTAAARSSLSRLAVLLPRWPAAWTALGALAVPGLALPLAPRSARRAASSALLCGAAVAVVTFGDTIDGIAEGAVVTGYLAGVVPFARLTPRGAALLALQGTAAVALCLTLQHAAPGVPPPAYPMWSIAPASLDALPPWGIDHVR